MTTTTTAIHAFEKAGLGKAPFRYVGSYEDRGPHHAIVNGVEVQVGAPGQPMGTCKFCFTGIALCCVIRSADGKEFVVGSECVRKTDDKDLRCEVDRERRKIQVAREEVRIDAMRERIDSEAGLRELLAGKPHPKAWKREQGESLLDSVEWMMKNAGHAGMLRTVRLIEKLEKKDA